MIEKHQAPPTTLPYGYGPPPANPSGYMAPPPGFAAGTAWNGAAGGAGGPSGEPPLPPEPHPLDKKRVALEEAQEKKKAEEEADKPDPSELAMLGIDPDDLSGFGK